MNWQTRNAQSELAKRRANSSGLPVPARSFVEHSLKDESPMDDEPALKPVRQRSPRRVSLSDLEITHEKVQAAIDAAHRWAERKRNGQHDISLVLLGPYGVGKTHIARAILWSMIQAAVDDDGEIIPGTERPVGRFYTGNDLMQLLDSNTYASSVVGNAPLIVIDDVGAEQRIDYAGDENGQRREKQQRYFKIINHCYDFQVSLIVTSNLSVPELKDCIGGRAWSRLSQMAPAGFMLDLTGVPDYRMKSSGR